MSINPSHISGKEALKEVAGALLAPYQTRFNRVVETYFAGLQEKSALAEACQYAMSVGGKRFRPALVWMVADTIQPNANVDLAALAVEFFHNSSLVSDDLPCMDNDSFRRGKPTTHVVYSESIALLASFALTAAGFEVITQIPLPEDRAYNVLRIAVTKASQAVGLPGIVGGQYLDLYPKQLDRAGIYEIIDRKTGALFEISLLFGWLFAGGSFDRIDEVSAFARHFGRAFQVVDDIDDMEQDAASGKKINFALAFGKEEASQAVLFHVAKSLEIAEGLRLTASPLVTLIRSFRAAVTI